MAHDKPKQSNGSWAGKRDKHEKPVSKGPQPPKNHGQNDSYKPKKFQK